MKMVLDDRTRWKASYRYNKAVGLERCSLAGYDEIRLSDMEELGG